MDQKRIYGQKVSINTEQVRDFYDKRAAAGANGSVLLGNQDPKYIDQRMAYDRDYVLPMLNVNAETRVLDIGCGIGRWASFILPGCRFYCGVDFSEEMVKAAKQTCQSLGGEFQLHCLSALDAVEQTPAFYHGRFDLIIIAGVCTYINDQDIVRFFQRLPALLAEHSTVYLSDPVGLEKRLTLNAFHSEELQTEYSAIYRTAEEYVELCKPLLDAGFSITKREYRALFGENHSDSSRYHIILNR